jgi:hypothetical protein
MASTATAGKALRNPKSGRRRMIVTELQRNGAKIEIELEFDGYIRRINGEARPPMTTTQEFLRNSVTTVESAMKSHNTDRVDFTV